jgi:hypothetical protein
MDDRRDLMVRVPKRMKKTLHPPKREIYTLGMKRFKPR